MKEHYYFAAMSIISAARLRTGEELPCVEIVTEKGLKYSGFHTKVSPMQFWEARQDVSNEMYKNYKNLYGVFYGTAMNGKLLEEYQNLHGKIDACDSKFLEKWGALSDDLCQLWVSVSVCLRKRFL